jgi:hypothetical protein
MLREPARTTRLSSRWGDLKRQVFVATNLQAIEPPGELIGVEFDRTCALEEAPENDLTLQPGQRSTHAVVDASSEGDVAARQATMQVDDVGMRECSRVPIGGAPEKKHGRPRRDRDTTEFGVFVR